ncbi:MAG: cytochrome c [Gemmatimonadota bacterium]
MNSRTCVGTALLLGLLAGACGGSDSEGAPLDESGHVQVSTEWERTQFEGGHLPSWAVWRAPGEELADARTSLLQENAERFRMLAPHAALAVDTAVQMKQPYYVAATFTEDDAPFGHTSVVGLTAGGKEVLAPLSVFALRGDGHIRAWHQEAGQTTELTGGFWYEVPGLAPNQALQRHVVNRLELLVGQDSTAFLVNGRLLLRVQTVAHMFGSPGMYVHAPDTVAVSDWAVVPFSGGTAGASFAGAPDPPPGAPLAAAAGGPSAPPDLTQARTTFQTVCATCHGKGGAGNGPGAAALNPKPANFTDPAFWKGKTDAELEKAIKDGGHSVGLSATMPAWGGMLSASQIQSMLAYLKTLAPTGHP